MMKFQMFRYFNHVSWFTLAILVIILFILGSFFAIFGVLGQDLGISLNYLFGSSQIYNLFSSNTQAAGILDVCINKGGDIADNYFSLQNTNVDSVNTLTIDNAQLTNISNNLTNNSQSITIPSINQTFQTMMYDIRQVSIGTGSLSPASVFIEWNKWSDFQVNNSYVTKCNNPPKDRWVQNSTLCPYSYTYYNKSSAGIPSITNSCLVISDWDNNVSIVFNSRL